MFWDRRRKLVQVSKLIQQITPLMTAGRAAQAVPLQREALTLARDLVAAEPADPDMRQGLAALLYGMGATLTDIGRPAEAVRLLDECQRLYEQLAVPKTYVADVCARRARAYSAAGRGVSAVLDCDEAVVRYLKLGAHASNSEHALDLARVLTLSAVVQHGSGDDDLAVAAAEEAIACYTSPAHAARISPVDFNYLIMALEVVAQAHTIAGRDPRAEDADNSLIILLDGKGSTIPMAGAYARKGLRRNDPALSQQAREIDAEAAADAVSKLEVDQLPTLEAALTAAGIRDKFRELVTNAQVSPTQSGRINGDPRLALTHGMALAPHASRLLGENTDAGLRLALETHYLLVFASRGRETNLRYNFGAFGPAWAGVVADAATALHRRGNHAIAQDLAGWLAGIVHQLQPFALTDQETGQLSVACQKVIDAIGLP